MGATVAMECSIEFRLLGFYTLWFGPQTRACAVTFVYVVAVETVYIDKKRFVYRQIKMIFETSGF